MMVSAVKSDGMAVEIDELVFVGEFQGGWVMGWVGRGTYP